MQLRNAAAGGAQPVDDNDAALWRHGTPLASAKHGGILICRLWVFIAKLKCQLSVAAEGVPSATSGSCSLGRRRNVLEAVLVKHILTSTSV